MAIAVPFFNVELRHRDTDRMVSSQIYLDEGVIPSIGRACQVKVSGAAQFARPGDSMLFVSPKPITVTPDPAMIGDEDDCPRSIPPGTALFIALEQHLAPDHLKVIDIRRNIRSAHILKIAKSILGVAKPDQIIVFGSSARTDVRAGGDIDVLVVLDHDPSLEDRARLSKAVRGLDTAVDMVIMSRAAFDAEKNLTGSVAYPAAREGAMVYQRVA